MPQLIILLLITIVSYYFWKKIQKKRQLRFIQEYKFHPAIIKRAREKHDYLTHSDMLKVINATKDYFYICNQANGKMVAMPSEIVDVVWHEFLLFTREYETFCKKGLGRFLHHTPTEAMKHKSSASVGLKRAWRLACVKEDINYKAPHKLPLLFEIDKKLKIKGGFTYSLNCKSNPYNSNSNNSSCGGYCATEIGCTSDCGGDSDGGDSTDGFFDSSSDSNTSSCSSSSCGGGD